MGVLINFEDYNDFQFEEDGHRYIDREGAVHMSITQMMGKVKIYDFSMVKPAVLENARRRGVNTHRWCAEFDLYGWCDPTWIADDELPYYEAWLSFRRDFPVKVVRVETPMLRPINGIMVGGTPDLEALCLNMQMFPGLFERKACASAHPGWAIQTAIQEMLCTGRSRVGHMFRSAVQLKPTGKYKLHIYEDPTDADVAKAVINLSRNPLDVESEIAVANWRHNVGLAA